MDFQKSVETKTISLLNFALEKKGLSKNLYHVGHEGDEKQLNDKICLVKSKSDQWLVFYTERGSISQKSTHSTLNEAAMDFFGRLTRKNSFWCFRKEWEQETGQLF